VTYNHRVLHNDLLTRFCMMAGLGKQALLCCQIFASHLPDWCDDFSQKQASRVIAWTI